MAWSTVSSATPTTWTAVSASTTTWITPDPTIGTFPNQTVTISDTGPITGYDTVEGFGLIVRAQYGTWQVTSLAANAMTIASSQRSLLVQGAS